MKITVCGNEELAALIKEAITETTANTARAVFPLK